MFEKILIPLDGSDTAERILPQVRRLLKRHRSEVILLRVIGAYPPDFHLAAPGIRRDAELYVRKHAFELIQDGVSARGFVRVGSPAETILDTATREEVTAIALATHGRTGLPRWTMGSVAEKVLRASSVPTLVVRSFPPPIGRGISRGRLEELPFRTVLVPLDGSEFARSVMPAVREFARTAESGVVLVNVFEGNPHLERQDRIFKPLDEPRKELESLGIPVSTDHRVGDAPQEILEASREHRADLIAMSTHGRTGPSRWVFGSVTEKVLREATLPLLIVRGSKKGTGALPGTEEPARQTILI